MSPDLLIVLAPVVAVALIVARRYRPMPRFKGLPYRSRGSLLSQGELALYRVLVLAVPAKVRVGMKVRLADLVSCPANAWREYGAPAAGKHLDFVLIDAETTRTITCVELDDKTHDRRDRQERDAFVDAALRAASIPIVRVRAVPRYDIGEVRKLYAALSERRRASDGDSKAIREAKILHKF